MGRSRSLDFAFWHSGKTKWAAAAVTTNMCKRAHVRSLLLSLPCDNTHQSGCVKKSPSHVCAEPQQAAGYHCHAQRAHTVPKAGDSIAQPQACAPASSLSCISAAHGHQAAPTQHCMKHMHLSFCRRRDFSHTHPHCTCEPLLQCKSAAIRRGTPFPGHVYTSFPHAIESPF